jgi:hypothetical protein
MLTQYLDCAFIRWRESFQYLDGRRLPGTIWTKQTKTLAREHFQIETIYCGHIGESLHEPRTPERHG